MADKKQVTTEWWCETCDKRCKWKIGDSISQNIKKEKSAIKRAGMDKCTQDDHAHVWHLFFNGKEQEVNHGNYTEKFVYKRGPKR